MVLAHYGDVRSEADLRTLLETQLTGTRAGNVIRLSGPAFEVYVRPSNLAALQAMLADNQPAIVFLQTGALDYWSMDIFHTAVLIGLDAMTVSLNDPYFATAPQSTSLQSFEKAWAATGQLAALIRPRRKP
jgi:ABC-type bacteriocin/lantibiotic exporter with double-glycine peptidase domain